MGSIKVTLYELFGYILPILFLVALAILFWTIYSPCTPIEFVRLSFELWMAIIIVSYFSGHMVQAISNLVVSPTTDKSILGGSKLVTIPISLTETVRQKCSAFTAIDEEDLDAAWIYKICDQFITQFGIADDRDMYIYREGFYRGLIVSFAAMCLVLIVRVMVPGASVIIMGSPQPIVWSILCILIIISGFCSWLAFLRYKRFVGYRVTQVVAGFLVLYSEKQFGGGR